MGLNAQSAGALVAIMVVPAVIGFATTTVTVRTGQLATEPKPVEAKLSVPLSKAEKRSGDQAFVRLLMRGAAPRHEMRLVDSDGLHTAWARPPEEACSDKLPRHETGGERGGEEWCLQLTGLDDGRQVQGVVAGPGTTLDLTVIRRAGWFWWPLLTALAGLLVGAGVLIVPEIVRASVRKGLLAELLADNVDPEKTPVENRIDGLADWVSDRQAVGEDTETLLPVVSGVIERGPSHARAARAALLEALRVARLPADHPFSVKAAEEATRTTHVDGDFLEDSGEVRDVHPAQELSKLLEQLVAQRDELENVARQIRDLPGDGCRANPQERLTEARQLWDIADDEGSIEAVEPSIRAVQTAVAAERAKPECQPEIVLYALGPSELRSGATPPLPLPALSQRLADVRATRALHKPSALDLLRGATIAMAIVAVLWTLLVLRQTVYEPKAAFGTLEDYVALAIAAIGSGAAAAVVGLVAPWNPHKPAGAGS